MCVDPAGLLHNFCHLLFLKSIYVFDSESDSDTLQMCDAYAHPQILLGVDEGAVPS